MRPRVLIDAAAPEALETKRGDVSLRQSYVRGSVHTDAGRVLMEDVSGDVQGTSSKGGVVQRRVERVRTAG